MYKDPNGREKFLAEILQNGSIENFEIEMQDKDNKIFKMNKFHTTQGTENEKGTGLGLLLCKDLAKKQGGDLTAESELGLGSIFTLRTPK